MQVEPHQRPSDNPLPGLFIVNLYLVRISSYSSSSSAYLVRTLPYGDSGDTTTRIKGGFLVFSNRNKANSINKIRLS